MALSEKEEFELLSLERERSLSKGKTAAALKLAHATAEPEESFTDKIRGGIEAVGEPLITAAVAPFATGVGQLSGAIDTITGGGFGTEEATRRGARRAQSVTDFLTPIPRNKTAQNVLETAGKAVDASKLAGLNPATAMPVIPGLPVLETAGKAVDASKLAGLNPATAMPVIPGLPAASRAAATAVRESPEAEIAAKAGQAAGKVATAAKPAPITPEVLSLARKAQELGIDIRPDMLSDNKFARIAGEALENVPLSGSRADQRQQAFNATLARLIGAENGSKRITPDVFDKAMTRSGETIGEISSKTPIQLAAEDPAGFDARLSNIVSDAQKFETSDVARIITNYAQELRDKAVDGVIPGETFRKINSKIGQQARSTTNGDLKNALGEFQAELHETLATQISSPEELQRLNNARREYAIGSMIEPLVAKTKVGDISPAGLMQAATADKSKKRMMARGRAGEVGELAKIGQLFLKEPKSSNTTERGLTYGALGGAGYVEPHTVAALLSMANLYNRAGPAIARRMTKAKDGGLPVNPVIE